jgi:CDP-diacylglycerol--glycerol-3-phosphate 3-phosphatidyltransferase
MSLYELKPRFQALLRPLTRLLHRAGVTANQVTVGACIISVLVGAALAAAPGKPTLFLLVPAWFLARMAFNAVDGMLAREFGHASQLGAYLNELGDVLSDAALYAPFALLPGSNPWLVGALIVLAAVSEQAGILGAMQRGGRRYDGPMGKSDRALVFGSIGLLVGVGAPVEPALDWIWWAVIALLMLTIGTRIRRGIAASP